MVKSEFQECLREITMLGFGLILICHSKEKATDFHDEDGNAIMSVEPDLPKNAYNVCNAICDIIGYINVEFEKDANGQMVSNRYLYTRQTPYVFAGSRYKYLAPKIPFGYNELTEAIGEALDKDAAMNGAAVVEHVETTVVTKRSFSDVMEEAKMLWQSYITRTADEEEQQQRLNILNDIVLKIFGKPIKLSTVVPSQQDMMELVIDELKAL